MNKLKLSLIAIATLVAGNTNAQTFYSCIPEECPSGQYFNGRKCLPLPTVNSGLPCSYQFSISVNKYPPIQLTTSKGVVYTCTETTTSYGVMPQNIKCDIVLNDGDSLTYIQNPYNSLTITVNCNNGSLTKSNFFP
ncbi:hypothetical protein HDR59_02415 [bacterium]|nr:hypothetical protein [bacterium]